MSLRDEPIIILGTFRSGTSAMATAFSRLGFYFGEEKDFQPADEFNQGGYWELRDMQVLNAKILTGFGTNYYQVSKIPENWSEMPGASAMVSEIRSLLRGKFSGNRRWAFKEPATSILLPLYKQALSDEGVKHPIYAIAVRHPLSVAASQNKRQSQWGYQEAIGSGGTAPVEERTLGLWTHYTLSSLRESRGEKRQVISYERFLSEPRGYLEWASDQLMDRKPSSEDLDAAVATVRPEWSHSKYTVEDLKKWSPVVMATYDVCLRADKDPEGFTAGNYDDEIEKLWNEWMRWTKMVSPIEMPAGQLMFQWREGQKPSGYAEKFTPTGTWQSMRVAVNVPPGADVLIDPYQMPCQFWIRRATWTVGGNTKKAALGPGPGGVLGDAFGMKRLTLFGPGALVAQVPPGSGDVEFEIEFMVQAGPVITNDVVTSLRTRLDQLRRQGAHPGQGGGRRM